MSEALEHRAGRVGLDLRFMGYETINEVLTTRTVHINGKLGDSKYIPEGEHSRPYYGSDTRMDPTLLNSIHNKYIDVSGLLIPNTNLTKGKDKMNRTFKPLKSYNIIV
jgi:hypothetical protein